MILEWPDSEIAERRARERREERYQEAMCANRRAGLDGYLTFFAFLPLRISRRKLIWLDWFEAQPVGMCHGAHGRRNGFAYIRNRTSWRYRCKSESFWQWLARMIVAQVRR